MMILLVLTVLVVVGMLVLFNLMSANRMPGKGKRAAEVRRLRADMDNWMDNLVAIDREELELFSLGQEKQSLRRGARTEAKGIFTTIYHEPVMAYSYRKYLGKQHNSVLLARTAEHDYVYWTRNGQTQLEIDGQAVGEFKPDGVLYGQRTGKELARLTAGSDQQYLPVRVGERELGSLTNRTTSVAGLNDRAFEFLQPNIDDREEQLFMALVIRELVRRTVS